MQAKQVLSTVITALLGIAGTIVGVRFGAAQSRDQWLRDQRVRLYTEVIDYGYAVLRHMKETFDERYTVLEPEQEVLDEGNARPVPDYPQLRARLLLLAHPDVVKPAMAVLALSRFVDNPYYMDKVNDDGALQASTDLQRLEDVYRVGHGLTDG